ncbi:MAG: GNAT family N-acetyltransferase [bacterium]
MTHFTSELQLQTLFELNSAGRILGTRESNPASGPLFMLIRSHTDCAWAVHIDVPTHVADELHALAQTEPPALDLTDAPVHAARYQALAGGRIDGGPVFTIPSHIALADDTVIVTELSQVEKYFRGWTASEISECSPIVAVCESGHAVSVCFCARRSDVAAEAGLETAMPFRGRGFGGRVTAAWARAIHASGRLPIYSTSWSNTSSRAVARKLGLASCASDWSLVR